MRELQRPYAGVERQILAAVKAKNSSVRAHVDLAQLFFSKKMLGSAETQLEEVRARLSTSYSLASLLPPSPARDRKTVHLMQTIAAVEDDISLVQQLRMYFNSPVTCLSDSYGGDLAAQLSVNCRLGFFPVSPVDKQNTLRPAAKANAA